MVTDILKKKQEEYGHPIYLVSDEPYRKLAYDIEVPYLTHYYENTIVVYSYSKALSIPGERIGYIAMESCVQDYEDLIAGMTASMRYLGYVNAPSLQQKMLLKCVDASVDISIYQETRDILYHALTEIGSVSYTHLCRYRGRCSFGCCTEPGRMNGISVVWREKFHFMR